MSSVLSRSIIGAPVHRIYIVLVWKILRNVSWKSVHARRTRSFGISGAWALLTRATAWDKRSTDYHTHGFRSTHSGSASVARATLMRFVLTLKQYEVTKHGSMGSFSLASYMLHGLPGAPGHPGPCLGSCQSFPPPSCQRPPPTMLTLYAFPSWNGVSVGVLSERRLRYHQHC